MRNIGKYIAFFWVILFVSCEKETLEPRTNPRFSVTIIQEISASGVQFGADIYDYGNEEILEYGFVYTQSTGAPNLNQDDYVGAQGRPEAHFELVGNHSMTLGKKYYVSAFLRTSTSLVFSEAMEFVSQGSEGFIINSIEWPEVIYRDQNLVVKGRRFSRQQANYKVKLGQFDLYPNLVDSTTVLLPLPEGLLTQTTGQDLEMELRIEISEKVYTEKRVLKFQEPEFEKQEVQKINLDDEVVIKGDYLNVGFYKILIENVGMIEENASKNALSFFPYEDKNFENSDKSNPNISVIVRGKTYQLGEVFDLNPSKVDQEEIVIDQDYVVIPGSNFNYKNLNANQIYDEANRPINFILDEVTASSLKLYARGATFPKRDFKARVNNFGKFSNEFLIKLEYPSINLQTKNRLLVNTYFARGQANETGYVLTDLGVIEESLTDGFSNKVIASLPELETNIFGRISTFVGNDFLYGGGIAYQTGKINPLFYFSTESKTWKKMANLPNGNGSFRRSYPVQDGYIFEWGMKFDPINNSEENQERWRYSKSQDSWTQLTDSTLPEGRTYLIYNWKGKTYAIFQANMSSYGEFQELTGNGTWQTVGKIDNYIGTTFSNPIIIENKLYLFQNGSELYEINLDTFQVKNSYFGVGNITYYSAFVLGKSIIVLSSNSLATDIRPDLWP
ncbi:Kelch repeat-containing protein [Algoriphagus boritolerans]|uniref:IPT/TIG domain-containing protein n=2 Tax=Algoriphagus TaxID=246875 RepID=A0A1H5WPR6_9BACT|nr:hypothetical protein [Algoriphagus boritolerans]SEG01273.1 hypothetical protein SAMN03080598_02198 [Algoriphagus boritolerans DSM 17298 = JCM 18970]